MPNLTPLAAPPSRASAPASYVANMDTWLAALPTLVTEINALDANDFLGGTLSLDSGTSDITLSLTSTDANCYLTLNDSSTTANSYVAVLANGDHLKLRAGNTNLMHLDSTGYVGVGTITPSARLDVEYSVDGPVGQYKSTHATYTNTILTIDAARAANSAYSFLLCRSAHTSATDTEVKLSGDGNGTCDGSWTGGGADYAEYFEWADGNAGGEDRRGVSVVLDGAQIRPAVDGEEPVGVISVNPSVIGDGDIDRWKEKYLRDDFGAYVWEDYEVVEWTETVIETIEVSEPVTGADGKPQDVVVTKEIPHEELHSYAADGLPEGVTPPADAKRTTQQRRALNPAYDPDREYIPRADRPEWATVGLMGKLRLRKGQPVGARWIKMRDISDTVEEWLVR